MIANKIMLGNTAIDKIMLGNVLMYQKPISYLAYDDFNGSLNPAWNNSINSNASFITSGGYLLCSANTSASMPFLYWDDGQIKKRITMDVQFTASNPRIVFRVKDGSNFLAVTLGAGSVLLQKVISGSWTTLVTYNTTLTSGNWYNFKIEDRETNINVYMNDTLIATSTDTTHNTFTKSGIRFGSATILTARFDNYKVEALT